MANKVIRIIGIPMDLGQSRRGVDMGPSAIRYAGLAGALAPLGFTVLDSGDIVIPGHCSLKNTSIEERVPFIRQACEDAYRRAREAIDDGEIPVFLGGDHSISIGTIGGVSHHRQLGVIWVDAHADFNTPDTSVSNNVHGMALSTLLGLGDEKLINVGRHGAKVSPENVVVIGLRDVDEKEKHLLKQSGVTWYTMRDIDELGIYTVLGNALNQLSNVSRIHVSFDMDVMDPIEAPGVGTPSHGGLTYREGQLIMETIADTGKLHSVDLVEVNPILDVANRTGQIAVSLLESLFGKSII